MAEPITFLDVDTQMDFMLPHGSLYVPGAVEIIPNLKRLMNWAREQEIPVISSADAHPPGDPSFREWPPHCVVGTPGQRRIPETDFGDAAVIANRPGAFTSPREWKGQFIVEKQEYDVSTNANFDHILEALGPRRFIVFGVATDYCVLWSVRSLVKRDLKVDLVTDAVKGIKSEGEKQALEEMTAAGVRFILTDAVCGRRKSA
jgi:nicotinamidase/pyrazinamidase